MKTILLIIGCLLLHTSLCQARLTAVLIGVNGLTCSQCTRNVEMQLRRLPFVAEVHMNLEHTNGRIQLKEESGFTPERIVKAVQDAGFSVRYLKVLIVHPEPYKEGGNCLSIGPLGLQLVGSLPQPLPDSLCLQLLGMPYQPHKEAAHLPGKTCPSSRYFVTLSREDAL